MHRGLPWIENPSFGWSSVPGSSAEESACNAGGLSSIPGSVRSAAEEITYPLYSWASLVVQMVKNLPQSWRPVFNPWVGKIPWRRTWQPTPVFLPGESPWTEEPGRLQSMGPQRVGHDWMTKHSIAHICFITSPRFPGIYPINACLVSFFSQNSEVDDKLYGYYWVFPSYEILELVWSLPTKCPHTSLIWAFFLAPILFPAFTIRLLEKVICTPFLLYYILFFPQLTGHSLLP